MAAQLANRDRNPMVAFFDTLSATMSQNHPRTRPLTVDRLGEINLDRALAIYRDRFGDAGDFTFVVVGAFTLDSIRPLVQRYLGGLPSRGRLEQWRDVGIRPPAGVIEKAVRRGVEPRSQTQILFTGPFEDTRDNRYALRSLTDLLRIRLRDRIREQLGGTYGVGVTGGSTRAPRQEYTFGINFGAAPERLDSLVQVVFEELRRIRDSLPTDQEVATLQESQRRGRETSLRQNEYWMGQLLGYYREGYDPRDIAAYEQLIAGLTPETLRQAAQRYLRMENYVRVSLYPESGATR
jgi:zinc protease